MVKKRLIGLVLLVMIIMSWPVMGIDYSNYCEDNSDLATDPEEWCEDHSTPFDPDGCGVLFVSCDLITSGPPNYKFISCNTLLLYDATNCDDISSFTGLSLICIDETVYDSEAKSCFVGCNEGIKFAKVLDACGHTGTEYSDCFENTPDCNSDGICNVLSGDHDYDLLSDDEYIDNMRSEGLVRDICKDDSTKAEEIPVFEGLQCEDTSGGTIVEIPAKNAAYKYKPQNYNILPGSEEACPVGSVCTESSSAVSCVEVEDEDPCVANPVTASIDKPDKQEYVVGYGVPYKCDEISDPKSYSWSFGDGEISSGRFGRHPFLSTGTYTVSVDVENKFGCVDTDDITLSIVPCEGNDDCMVNQECISSVCAFVEPEDNETIEEPEALEVTINSPENKIYSTTSVQLKYSSNRETQCAYSLNNAGMKSFEGTTTVLDAVEGENTVTLNCEDTVLSRSFRVNLTHVEDKVQEFTEEENMTQEEVESIIGQLITEGNITVMKLGEIEGDTTKLTFKVKNDRLVPLKDIFLNINFPKSIVQSAGMIKSSSPYNVIEEDPIIAFDIGSLMPGEEMSVSAVVEEVIIQDQIETIMTDITTTVDEEALAEMRESIEATADAADVSVKAEEIQKDGETYTKITTSIVPKQAMNDVDLYQEIPKCLAKHIDELNIPNRQKLKIINPDPLIVWHFDEVKEEIDLTFDVKGILDPDCIKQIKNLPLAKKLGWVEEEPKASMNLFLPLLLIPIVALIIILFAKFKPKHKKQDEAKTKHEQIREKALHHEADMKKFFQKHMRDAEEELRRSMK